MCEPETDHALGRDAATPPELPPRGWWQILLRVWREMSNDNLSLVAAGIAMFALLAVAPTLVAIVSIYGLFAEPSEVAGHLSILSDVMPGDAQSVIVDQAESITSRDESVQGFGVVFGILLALWSARRGMVALLKGLNLAYFERESRGFFRQLFISVAYTAAAIVAVTLVLLLTVLVPMAVEILDTSPLQDLVLLNLRWALLWLFAVFGITLLYRLGPSRERAQWRWLATGSVVAGTLWLLASMVFSKYVQHFGEYGETYGAIGGVIVLLLWFQLSAFLILLGARLNAEMEHQTAVDTTTGPTRPLGQRGAVVADSLPESGRVEKIQERQEKGV